MAQGASWAIPDIPESPSERNKPQEGDHLLNCLDAHSRYQLVSKQRTYQIPHMTELLYCFMRGTHHQIISIVAQYSYVVSDLLLLKFRG